MRYRVVNLGCKVNRVESDAFARTLSGLGCPKAPEGCADLVVINTCTVTGVAEKKTRKAVRHSLGADPEALVVVTGCAAAQNPSLYEAMSPRVKVVQKWDMDDFLGSLEPELDASAAPADTSAVEPPFLAMGRARVGVKVQDGCSNECAYCIVHKLRGPEVSTSPESVLEQARQAAGLGAAEVVLAGINLGRYKHGQTGLAGLLRILDAAGLPCRFRLSSIEPDNVDDDLIELLASTDGRVCRHLHLPLQSGSNKVLREMGRNYSADDFWRLAERLRAAIPGASLSTDVIAGFPGESSADFDDTTSLCRACGFSKMHVFPYSEREGTPAAERPDQVPREMRLERAAALRRLGDELRAADLASRRGTVELAVVEDETWCTTESYHDVRAPKGALPGELVEVRL